jgi:hypothetical protein
MATRPINEQISPKMLEEIAYVITWMRAGRVINNGNSNFSPQVDKRTMQVKCVVSMQRDAYSFEVRIR